MSNKIGLCYKGSAVIESMSVGSGITASQLLAGTPVTKDASYKIIPCPANALNTMIGVVWNDGDDSVMEARVSNGVVNIAIGGDGTINMRLATADQTAENLAKIKHNIDSAGHTDFIGNDHNANIQGIRFKLGAVVQHNDAVPLSGLAT